MTNISPTPEDQSVIKRAARLHLYHTLASHPEVRPQRVLPSMISDYVDGTHPDTDGAIAEALRTELVLRRLYNHLRERNGAEPGRSSRSLLRAGQSAEARLVLDHVTLYWREVVANSGRWMLQLRLHDDVPVEPDARPVLHLEWDTVVARIVFPEMVDGMTQYVLADRDPRLERLKGGCRAHAAGHAVSSRLLRCACTSSSRPPPALCGCRASSRFTQPEQEPSLALPYGGRTGWARPASTQDTASS